MSDCVNREEGLSRLATGELEGAERAAVEDHLEGCENCHTTFLQFQELSRLGAAAYVPAPGAEAARRVLARVREALVPAARSSEPPGEVMTLAEAARFLRVDEEELAREIDSLPVFEVGGQMRLRKERLLQWTEERERRQRGGRSGVGRM